MTRIHATAIVDPRAQIGKGVEVGPYSVIGPHVTLGDETVVGSHAVIDGHTRIGRRCTVFVGACLGMQPQDKKFKNVVSYLEIGDDNVIREYVTLHAGSTEGSKTKIGNKNYLMVACHVGHDALIGDNVTMANGCLLGGFTVVEDMAVLGGYAGVHQHVRVGKLSMLGAFSKAVMDVPPFSICEGHRAKVCGVNVVGLRRNGYSSRDAAQIKKAIKILCMSDLSLPTALKKVKKEADGNESMRHLIEFFQHSKRGLSRASEG